jgi:hypothetical protein
VKQEPEAVVVTLAQRVGGFVTAGFFGVIGERLFNWLFGSGQSYIGLVSLQVTPGSSFTDRALVALLNIAFWLALFGILASLAFGIAGVLREHRLRPWCYAVGNSSHLLANVAVLYVVARSLGS